MVKKNIAKDGARNVIITAKTISGNISSSYSIKVYSKFGYCNAAKTVMYDINPESGVLRIFGNGPIEISVFELFFPWNSNEDVKSIVIENGVTCTSSLLCYGTSITNIKYADSVETIRDQEYDSTYDKSYIEELELPAGLKNIHAETFLTSGNTLKNIVFHSNAPKIYSNGAIKIDTEAIIHVPEDAIGFDKWNISNQIIYDQTKIGNQTVHIHEWDTTVVEDAKCETEGSIHYECKTCGESYDEKIPALGHNYSEYISDNNATCTENGTKTSTCSRCKDKITVEDIDSALGHNIVVDEKINSSCHSTGLSEGEHCSRCGLIIKKQLIINKLEHDYDNGEIIEKASVEKEGKIVYKCKNCDDIKELIIPKLDNEEDNFDRVKYVYLSNHNISLTKGNLVTLSALVYPVTAVNQNIKWNSGNISVAIVDADGNIAALGVGRTTITVKSIDGDKTDQCIITVWGTYDAPKPPVIKETTIDSIELEKVDDCEYSLDGKNWQLSNIFTDLSENTEYTVYMRRKANNSEYYRASESCAGIVVKTASKRNDNADKKSDNTKPNDPKSNQSSTETPTTKPTDYSTEQPTSQQKSSDESTIAKPTEQEGVGTISADGKTLTDSDGVKYLIIEKMTLGSVKKNVSVADKKSSGKYKITKVTKKNGKITGGTVTYMKPYNKNCKTANIKKTINIAGATFKVTDLNKNAFKNCKKLTKVTVGANITKIGANAFNGCKKLKTITIKTTKLKNIGSKAFKGINSKAKFKLPKKLKKKQVTKYKKMITKAKATKKAKITK